MTEDKILAGNFVFISYSHSDINAVRDDIQILHSRGVRIWFDENMHLSDNWKDIAKEKLTHPNCKGVIFYNSKSSILSGAVSLERQIVASRMKTDAEFGYWSVNIDGKTMQEIYAEAMISAPANFLPTLQYELLPLFNDDILYIPRIETENFIERIFQEIARKRMLVDDAGLVKTELEMGHHISRDTGCITFGKYIDQKYPIPLRHDAPNERFTVNGIDYISRDDDIYTLRSLQWKLLYVENDIAVFLCNEIIDVSFGGVAAQVFLAEFGKMAFSDKQRELLNAVPRLLTRKDIEKTTELSALPLGASPNPRQSHWWIDEDGLLDNWQMTYCNDKAYSNGFIISVKKGVRPVIELPIKRLNDLKEDR